MQLFKGYVITNDKKAVEKIKGRTDFKNFDQVQSLPEYAGILAAETILIDIDDFETSEVLFRIIQELQLKCRVYKTSRGKHFLFKNNGVESNKTHCTLSIGLIADIKLGTRNSYEVLKYDGKEREIIHDAAEDEIQLVPKWMFPIKTNMEFLNMDAGDGRNQALFNYILTLQSNDFSIEEARECIRIINNYVLNEPLSDKELNIVLRDDAFAKPVFFKGTTFLHDKFAIYLKNNNHIIKLNDRLHIYRDGIYLSNEKLINNAMIQHIPSLNKAKRAEVVSYLDNYIIQSINPSQANLIAFKNGVYDLNNDQLLNFSPEYIITNKINWDYNPAAYSELADKTLSKIACHDEQIRKILEEVIGYCFYRRNELAKAFILTGTGSNGKSTFLDMLKTLVGKENYTSLDMKQLGEKFKTADLFGKLVNLGDDIHEGYIDDSSVFKKLVSGETVSVERKGQDSFEFNNYSKLLFSANSVPRMRDRTGAVLRRLIIIPFNAKFTINDPDFQPYIKYELQGEEVMEYLIILGIAGLKRVLDNKGFTISTKVEKELEEYEEINNPIIGFFKEVGELTIENEPTNKVYRRYQEYCLSNNFQPLSNIQFSRDICNRYSYETRLKKSNGTPVRIFMKR